MSLDPYGHSIRQLCITTGFDLLRQMIITILYVSRIRCLGVSDRPQDAAAAALFTACKIEDTLKKSKDILCAAYNLKLPTADHVSPDDPVRFDPNCGLL